MQKRILIVRTDKVGDVVMITPVIRELRKKFPDSFIGVLTNENSSDVLTGNPNLDVIIKDSMRKDTFTKVVKELRSYKFTDGLLIMPTERAAYQMFLAGVRNRIGVGRKLYEVITLMKSVSRNKYIPLRHEADYCMDLARKLGVVTNDLTPEIFLSDEEIMEGFEILNSIGCKEDSEKIIIHTGSGNSSRNWSEEKYSLLIKEIIRIKPSSQIILTAKEMTSSFRNKINALKNSNIFFADQSVRRLRDLIKIISNSDLLIASSTGPLHIASALNIKTVGLYCHRPMNCAKHWGALGNIAVNLEVSKEFCDLNCSSDKEVCNFENGIEISEVIRNIGLK
ncbi:MAG TPA: glycosyltransferase family 9 protein [Ignavibacteria bacterium]|nr:ADP-heptose--LPS heptosyltransferase [Bacteroidota bacterium]HRI83953.1 glycosyltransferase family 9 protein [Ignavibacteria bacterium]HRJ98722.1 glycosyltransferase family 9 protein [Ignavibacteria bacterium]